ncbi:MAG: cryptochrome/photolyase family protein, partial [Pseudomonadota bacterium]|nr:cryptochrome/photolyase family protein [Pseudomonadota bacterium]
DVSAILTRLKRHNIETIGHPNNRIVWPTTRTQARELLSHFCQFCLPNFGRFQDAMAQNSEHAWSLYHSRISFSLNTKMLSPRQVIAAAIDAFENSSGSIDIAQIEGFVRQILGWREYVRAMYWINMPDYRNRNQLKAVRTLPEWFWTANTRMNCLHKSIEQSLQFSYAHHIQRLMITGNFSLLAGIDPDQVDDWYLGIYIDAIEWVELPNTRGMSQFADGGWIASKPYAASGNYIHKMSDYCGSCYYNVKIKTGNNACPFNLLYWGFIDRHLATFEKNPRMSFPVKNWLKRSPQDRLVIRQQADSLLENLEEL